MPAKEKGFDVNTGRTWSANAIYCGHLISKPQLLALSRMVQDSAYQPQTFQLTTNSLGVGCGQKWYEVVVTVVVVGSRDT
jgi:hypothetical protein